MTSFPLLARFVPCVLALVIGAGCDGSEAEPTPSGVKNGASTDKPAGPPALVAQAKLEALLPAQVADWPRCELRFVVQKTGEGDVAQADAVYRKSLDPPWVYLSLLDTRGFLGPQQTFKVMHDQGGLGITPFVKTGQPALEQFWPKPLYTSCMTLVNDRFLVIVSGEGCDQPTVRQFLDALDIEAIAGLK
jgi:hypothetical protein